MYLSSKLVACAGLGTLLIAAPALAAGLATGPGMARPVMPHMLRFGPGPGRFGDHRFRRFAGYGGGYGFGGPGISSYQIEGEPPPPVAPPEPLPLPIPPQPACPMIIKVGPGLDHPVRTQVIYGRPACY